MTSGVDHAFDSEAADRVVPASSVVVLPRATKQRGGRSRALELGILPVALWLAWASPAQAAGLFANFDGPWQGRGAVTLTDGSSEAIRCKAAYSVHGEALSVEVDCASDSYRVHITADVIARGDAFAGSWQETTRGIGGTVSGRVLAHGEMRASSEATVR